MNTQDVVVFSKITAGRVPTLITPKAGEIKLTDWTEANQEPIDQTLLTDGALLFRGFAVTEDDFSGIVKLMCKEPLEYVYRSTPRTQVAANVYTATEYPPHHSIPFHNEEAYTIDWPMRLVFFCALPAEQGGETPIADTVKVTGHIDPHILEKCAKKKIMYVRNYGTGVDLSWQTVFQTDSKDGVEEFCQNNMIEWKWKPDGGLRTWQICQAVAEHPQTGQLIWFNQAHLFHVSSLDERTRRAMLSIYKESELPRNTYYGDGSPIELEVLEHIRAAFDAERVAFPWQKNDVMLLDNMLVSHARNPFKGKRRILAGMGEACSKVRRSLAVAV
jgi:hypothetical protein